LRRELVLREELNLTILYPQNVLLEIDACLVSFEHVESEEEIDVASLRGILERMTKTEGGRQTSMIVKEHGRYRSLNLI
jgi:hypothetical protein